MADYPSINPGAAASGAAGAAASVYNALQNAAAMAARQGQAQQQQQLKDQFETELKMRKDGYTPYASGPHGKLQARPDVDSNQIVTDPFGRRWVAPSGKPEATPQQTFSDTAGLLQKGARPVDAGGNVDQMRDVPRYSMDEQGRTTDTGMFGIHGAAPAGMTVTPPGSQQPYFVPGEEEKAGLKSRLDAAAHAALPGTPHVDTEHFSSPVIIDPKGGKATPIQLPDGVTHNGKPERPDAQSIVPGLTGPNGGLVVFDKNTQTTSEIPVPKGAKRELTPAQVEARSRADQARQDREDRQAQAREDRFQTQRDGIQKQLDVLDRQEQAQHELRVAYGTVLATPNGQPFIDPDSKKSFTMSDPYRKMYQTRYQRATDTVGTIATQKQRLAARGQAIGQTGGQPAGQSSGEQTRRGGGRGPLTDTGIVQNYLQKAGGDKAKARKLAAADGWTF